jgi:DNA repair exonuclease SbcCD ATPase subunit
VKKDAFVYTLIKYLNYLCRDARIEELEKNTEHLEEQLERLDWERQLAQQNAQSREDALKAEREGAQRREDTLKAELKTGADNLTKAYLCIQGFVKENEKLAAQLEKTKQEALRAVTRGSVGSEIVALARIGSGHAVEQMDVSHRANLLVREGVERAAAKFRPALAAYRGRYDRVRSSLGDCRRNCALLRQRMEELGDFLQQLLTSWEANETLNLSALR